MDSAELNVRMQEVIALFDVYHDDEAGIYKLDLLLRDIKLHLDAGQDSFLGAYANSMDMRAQMLKHMRRNDEALASFEIAIPCYERLAKEGKHNLPTLVRKLAASRKIYGELLLSLNRPSEALAMFDQAIFEATCLMETGVHDLAQDIPYLIVRRAHAFHALDRLAEAVAAYDKAIAYYLKFVDLGMHYPIGDLIEAKDEVLHVMGHPSQAIEDYDRVISVYREVTLAGGDKWMLHLARKTKQRASNLFTKGRWDDALIGFEDAISQYQILSKSGDHRWADCLDECFESCAQVMLIQGRYLEALENFYLANNELNALVEEDGYKWLGHLAKVRIGQGRAFFMLGDVAFALDTFDFAIEVFDKLIKSGQNRWVIYRLDAKEARTHTLRKLENYSDAIAEHKYVIEGLQALIATGETQWQGTLFQALISWAMTLVDSAQCLEALECLQAATGLAFKENLVVFPQMLANIGAVARLAAVDSSVESIYVDSLKLLENYLESYQRIETGDCDDQESALRDFWSHWMATFVAQRNYELVLDVVTRAHGRHTAAQAMAALLLDKAARPNKEASLDHDQQNYVALEHALHDVERQLGNFFTDGTGSGFPSMRGVRRGCDIGEDAENDKRIAEANTRRYEGLREKRSYYLEERRRQKETMIAADKLPVALRAATMSESSLQIEDGEALAIWVMPEALGLGDMSPFALLKTTFGIEALFLNEKLDFAQAGLCEKQLIQALGVGRCVRNSGSAPLTEAAARALEDWDVGALDAALRNFLEQDIWPLLNERCQALKVKTLHMITTGSLHSLPWQGTRFARGRNLYLHPGPFAYKKYKDTRDDSEPRVRPQPSPKKPLLVLAHEAKENIEHRLYCIPLEIACLKAVWGETALCYVDNLYDLSELSKKSVDYAALVCLGHGGFDEVSGQAGLVLGFNPDQYFNESELSTDANRYCHLEASACVLGNVTDNIRSEPSGLMATALAKSTVTLVMGSTMPVDDLLATIRTLLVHVLWRDDKKEVGKSLRAAAREALVCMESGEWPVEAIKALRLALICTLPTIARAMEQDGHKLRKQNAVTTRIDRLRLDLTLDGSPQGLVADTQWKRLVHAVMADPPLDHSPIVQQLSTLIATSLPAIVKQRDDLLAFTRYWMIC